MDATKLKLMVKLFKWLVVMIFPLCIQGLTSCSGDDDPSLPSTVPTEKKETYIACFDSNYGDLPSYATALYEDSEYKYLVAARSPKYELILLPFYQQDGEWVAAYDYNANKEVGQQLVPLKHDDDWLCSIAKYPKSLSEASLEAMTEKMSFGSSSTLSVAPFNYRGCYYGYLTVAGNKKVNIRIYCSFLKMNKTQGSNQFGYITNAKLEYQFY